jgi:hypothetical protein
VPVSQTATLTGPTPAPRAGDPRALDLSCHGSNNTDGAGNTRAAWEHSDQFNGTCMLRRVYGERLLEAMGLKS